tara:strand:+ start:10650 stop:13265 length:2616 start_codon:yes stop_codon:yes gene_type:complete
MGFLDTLGSNIQKAIVASAPRQRDTVKELEFAQEQDINRAQKINNELTLEKKKYRVELQDKFERGEVPSYFLFEADGDAKKAKDNFENYYREYEKTRKNNPLDETITASDILKVRGIEGLASFQNNTDFSRGLLGNGKYFSPTSTLYKDPETGEILIRPDVNTVDPETGEIRTTGMTDDGSNVRDLDTGAFDQLETRGISLGTLDNLEKGFNFRVKQEAGVDKNLAFVTNPYLGDSVDDIFDPNADRALKTQLIAEAETNRQAAIDANAPIEEAISQAEESARQRAAVEEFKAEEEAAGRPFGAPAETSETPETTLATSIGPYQGLGENTEGKELLYGAELITEARKLLSGGASVGLRGPLMGSGRFRPPSSYVKTPGQKHPFDTTDIQWEGLDESQQKELTNLENSLVERALSTVKNKLTESYKSSTPFVDKSDKDTALVKAFYKKMDIEALDSLLLAKPEKRAEFRADPYTFALNNKVEDLQGGPRDKEVDKIISKVAKDPEIKLSKIDQAIEDGDVETLKSMLKKIPEVLTDADYNKLVEDNQQRQGNMASYAKKQRQLLYMSYLSNLGDFDNPESVGAKTLAAFLEGKSNALFYETGQWDLAAEELAIKQEGNRIRDESNKISRGNLNQRIAEFNRNVNKDFQDNALQYSVDGRAHRSNMNDLIKDITPELLADSSANSQLNLRIRNLLGLEEKRLSPIISAVENGQDISTFGPKAITDFIAFQQDENYVTKLKLIDQLERPGFVYSLFFDADDTPDEGFIDKTANALREWFFQPSQPARVGEGGPTPKFVLDRNQPITLTKTTVEGRSFYGPEAFKEAEAIVNSGKPLLIQMPNGATLDARDLVDEVGNKGLIGLILDTQRMQEGT